MYGISSCQLARGIKVTQTTAWHILHKVRALLAQDDAEAFCGEVECDEAVYRWNTRKAFQSERFEDMFNKSIGLIVTSDELRLCKAT
jgi:hypothetical protein